MVDFFRKWDAKLFHVDEELARFFPVGGLVASLIHILSVISRLGSVSEGDGTVFLALLEMERFQIFNPVRPGDKLMVTEEYLDKRNSCRNSDRGIVRMRNEVKIRRGNFVSVLFP